MLTGAGRFSVTRNPGITIGLILALVTLVALQALPRNKSLDVLAMILVAAAAVYVGSALVSGDTMTLAIEVGLAAVFFVVALLGRWYLLPVLAGGYVAHGLWDLAKHRFRLGADAGAKYPLACWVYDWIVAAVILIWF